MFPRLMTLTAVFMFFSATIDAQERYLLPVFVDVPGAHGSKFVSELRVFNPGSRTATARGLVRPASSTVPVPPSWLELAPGLTSSVIDKAGNPGLLVDSNAKLRMTLRVHDTSRNHLSAGTQIPVIHESEMIDGPVFLVGVRNQPDLFRNRLRVYSFSPGSVRILFIREPDNHVLHELTLDLAVAQGVFESQFYPAFAETADFPLTDFPVRVQVEPLGSTGRLWAFVTTTNNQTQEITVLSPQP